MKKQHVVVDWSSDEDEQTWAARSGAWTTTDDTHEAALATANRQEWRLAMLLGICFLLLGMGWIWQSQRMPSESADEIQIALLQELQTQSVTAQPAIMAASTPLLPTSAQVETYQQLGNHIMAQVTVSYPIDSKVLAYRETHFYQQTEDQWRRVAPDPAFMGPAAMLRTAHFTVLYQQIDAVAVAEAAPKLEQRYAKLRGDLGLSSLRATSSYTVEVVADGTVSGIDITHPQSGKLTIPSPSLLSVPVEISPATALYQSVLYSLSHLVVAEAVEASSIQHKSVTVPLAVPWRSVSEQRYLFVAALRLWTLWKDGGPLATERENVVRWLYNNVKHNELNAHQLLPAGYSQLCRTFDIWGLKPVDVYIPLACHAGDAKALFVPPQRASTLPSWLEQLLYPTTEGGILAISYANPVMTATAIEYLVATYGEEKLPLLMRSLDVHTGVDTLIPAVFGMSAADFEAGWKSYLAAKYGVK